MGIVQHTINGRAIAEAVKENGVSHIRREWFGGLDADGKPTAGCAIGLMAINLGVRANNSTNEGANLFDQLNTLSVPENSKWYIHSVGTLLGSTIIYWNDETKNLWDDDGSYKKVYLLSTFEEVQEMVHELLEPHFDKEFVVDVWEFEAPSFAPDEEDDEHDY